MSHAEVEAIDLRPVGTYLANVTAGQLSYQRCAECRSPIFYPRVLCPFCGGVRLGWERSAGLGTVYSVSSIPRRDGDAIVVCLVDVDEGFRMMSNLIGDNAGLIKIGERVQVGFDHVQEPPRVVFTALRSRG
jgi:uncharacterized OB-fold protein